MQVIIEINGRQALPVRSIPLLTDWHTHSPDQLAKNLAGDCEFRPSFGELTAYILQPDGSTVAINKRWWASWVVRKLQAISDAIEATQVSHETGSQQWRRESLKQLPAGVFVWRDEFESAHASEYGDDSLRARSEDFNPSIYALDFNPQPDPEIAPQYLVLEGFVLLAGDMNRGCVQAQRTALLPTGEGQASTNADVPKVEPADPERRLALLRELGGRAIYCNGDWAFRGISKLVASEKAQGSSRSDEKTIRADLKEAAQNELDEKRAGYFSGLGQR